MSIKKVLSCLTLSIIGLMTITSCGYIYNESIVTDDFNNSSESEEPNDESESNTGSPLKTLINLEVLDRSNYSIGETYSLDKEMTIYGIYADGSKEVMPDNFVETIYFSRITVIPLGYEEGVVYDPSAKFEYPGIYTVKAQINDLFIVNYSFEVLEGLTDNKLKVTGIDVDLKNVTFSKGEIIDQTISAEIKINYSNGGIEKVRYNKNTKLFYPQINLDLYAEGDDLTNRIFNPLEPRVNYKLVISLNNFAYIKDIYIELGYERLNEMSFVTSDFDKKAIKATGDAKILVVPIYFGLNDTSDSIDDAFINELSQCLDNNHIIPNNALNVNGIPLLALNDLATLYNYYFVDTEAIIPSMHTFFRKSSFNQFYIHGAFSTPRFEDLINFDFRTILNDSSEATLHQFLQKCLDFAVENIKNNGVYPENPNFTFSDYDLNFDGAIDTVHFVTNIDHLKVGENSPLAPHSGYANTTSSNGGYNLNRFYISTFKSLMDIESAFDEKQVGILNAVKDVGLSLGLKDYDNKSDIPFDVNYVGHSEMMSTSIMDFGSFSKMANGWMSPYVVDGLSNSIDITIRSYSTYGDCIIVPADYSTYNGSAYDEYFLIEFFAGDGNNKSFLDIYNYFVPEGGKKLDNNTHGVRIHHVDARLVKKNLDGTYSPDEFKKGKDGEWVMPLNNSVYYNDYKDAVYAPWADFKLISTIQKEKVNSFGAGGRTYLSPDDLFVGGDKFTFEDYKHFLSKMGNEVSTMDNGEIFPYQFEIIEDTFDHATIRITK